MAKPLRMTPARWITLVLGLPAALFVIGWNGLSAVAWVGRGSYPVHYSVPVSGAHASISFDGDSVYGITFDGDSVYGASTVRVRPGTAGRVTVSGTVRYSLIRPDVSVRSTASGVTVRSHCLQQLPVSCAVDFAVAVPAGLGADVSAGAGDLSASGLTGPVLLSTQSGDVRVARLAGDVQIKSESGSITASALSGPHIRLEGQSGDISVTSLTSQDVTVSVQSGHIMLRFAAVPQRVVITGESGDITLVLPLGSTAYRVTSHTSSGSTVTDVPTSPGSSHVITVTTQSGNITITR